MVKDTRGSCPGSTQALPYLEGLDESPQEDADGVALAKQLDQPRCPEEAKEAQVDEVVLQKKKRCFQILCVTLKKGQQAASTLQTLPQVPVTRKKCIKRNKNKVIALV